MVKFDLRTRIAAIQRTHREELCEENVCICGYHGDYPKHVADAVIRDLGNLREVHTYYRPDGTPVTVLEGNYPARFDAEERCYGGLRAENE